MFGEYKVDVNRIYLILFVFCLNYLNVFALSGKVKLCQRIDDFTYFGSFCIFLISWILVVNLLQNIIEVISGAVFFSESIL